MCELCLQIENGFTDERVLVQSRVGAVFFHRDRATRAHLVVVNARHVENLSELSAREASDFMVLLHHAERVALHVTGARRAVLMKLGLAVPHLHMHIYPVPEEMPRHELMARINSQMCEDISDEAEAKLFEKMREFFQPAESL